MEEQVGWTLRLATDADRNAVLLLPAERWQESDTLNEEFSHLITDHDKRGYVCAVNNIMTGFIAVYMGSRGRDLVLLHKRIAARGFSGYEMLRRLLQFAVQDLSNLVPLDRLVLTLPGNSYALLKNTFLGPCMPLFNRKSLLLRGSMPYVLQRLQSMPASNLVFLDGERTMLPLLPQTMLSERITVRGDPVCLVDLLEGRLPFHRVRCLLSLSRRAGQLGGLSVGTVKMDSETNSNVLHIDVHTRHWETLQSHVVQHLTLWTENWRRASSFYLEINHSEDIDLSKLLFMSAKLGMLPRDECAVKTLVSLDGAISDLQLGH